MGKITRIFSALFVIAICVAPIFNSCSSNGCMDNQSSIPLAGFYSSQTKGAITVDSLTLYGVGAPGDSVLYSNQSLKQAYMPLRITTDETQYVFHYEQKKLSSTALNDTLTIEYKKTPFFVSSECGTVYIFDIEDFAYTKHLIDSIKIPTMKITNADVETVKVYFRTANNS